MPIWYVNIIKSCKSKMTYLWSNNYMVWQPLRERMKKSCLPGDPPLRTPRLWHVPSAHSAQWQWSSSRSSVQKSRKRGKLCLHCNTSYYLHCWAHHSAHTPFWQNCDNHHSGGGETIVNMGTSEFQHDFTHSHWLFLQTNSSSMECQIVWNVK